MKVDGQLEIKIQQVTGVQLCQTSTNLNHRLTSHHLALNQHIEQVTLLSPATFLFLFFLFWSRHERIHTKRGSQVKMPSEPEEANDLATLEFLDEVNPGHNSEGCALSAARLPLW